MKYQITRNRHHSDADFMILSSGLGGHAAFWQPQIDALAEHFHVLSYDQEGCHADTKLLPVSYSMTNMAEMVLEILEKENISKCHFMGHALGGHIGAELALIAEEKVKLQSLTLINAWDSLDPHTLKCFQTRIALLKNSGAEAYVRAQALFLYPPAYISKNIAQITQSENAALPNFPPIENVLARLNALMQFKFTAQHRDALQAVDLHIISNKDDFLVPYQKSLDLQAFLGHGKLSIFETGAHASTVTETQLLNQSILSFFQS